MDIGVSNGRIVGVRGREVDRVNRGRLGPKGLHGWVASHSPDRLTQPLIRREGKLQPATWDKAMDLIVRRIPAKEDLFVIVQDAFPTETTELADVVLPAANWPGWKPGINRPRPRRW